MDISSNIDQRRLAASRYWQRLQVCTSTADVMFSELAREKRIRSERSGGAEAGPVWANNIFIGEERASMKLDSLVRVLRSRGTSWHNGPFLFLLLL